MKAPITYDLSASGGPECITLEDITRIATQAKTRVKQSGRGWSVLSQLEIIALAWFADLFLQDITLQPRMPGKPEPTVISHV